MADEQATLARTLPINDNHSHWPEQSISSNSKSGRILGHLSHELRYCCTHVDLPLYWQERYDWGDSVTACIDLRATKAAISKLTSSGARRIQKLRCGWWPVNSRLAREQPDRHKACAACKPDITETVNRIFQCPTRERQLFVFQKGGTSPIICRTILQAASAWIAMNERPKIASLLFPDSALGTLVKKAYLSRTVTAGMGRFLPRILVIFTEHRPTATLQYFSDASSDAYQRRAVGWTCPTLVLYAVSRCVETPELNSA